jgi:adenosylcobinamide kinase/adenosylcobinamide-phosphate guanylyltransferase
MNEEQKILVIGGCRSGKSTHALCQAERIGERRLFVATCVPKDDEMKARVSKHRKDRDESWNTLEIPVDIPEAITQYGPSTDVMLVDCLTLWLNNLLMETQNVDVIQERIHDLARSIETAECSVVLVSNEVGSGIVPENPMARLYRDLAGWTHQAVAEVCSKVVWTVAGIPVTIKPCSPDAPV